MSVGKLHPHEGWEYYFSEIVLPGDPEVEMLRCWHADMTQLADLSEKPRRDSERITESGC